MITLSRFKKNVQIHPQKCRTKKREKIKTGEKERKTGNKKIKWQTQP